MEPNQPSSQQEPIIYCIEGHWHWPEEDDQSAEPSVELLDPCAEPSVEPLLQMLQRQGLWKYMRRNAATADELFYWMKNEWSRCASGSILYFATHGREGEIWLSKSSVVPIEQFATEEIDCSKSLVHFSSCSTLACDKERIIRFMNGTGAVAVSGYLADVGWTSEAGRPAAILDLNLFSEIRELKINLAHGSSRRRLEGLKEKLKKRFDNCEFDLHLK